MSGLATLDALARIRLLALDVDGTLTDGGVYFDDRGGETKRFHIHDGLGIVLAHLAGLQIAWVTGRTSEIVARRARELHVSHLRQGVRDKTAVLAELVEAEGLTPDLVAYMGDDLNDLPTMRWAGVAIVPANAVAPELQALAPVVTPRSGGAGAVRDAIEMLLRARGDWDSVLAAYLASLSAQAETLVQ